MTEKKQSSVEWLILEIKKRRYVGEFVPYSLFEQAKAIHKAEIINAYQAGDGDAYNLDETRDFGEQYYNETFEK